jgi:hypothetical protein
MKLGITSRKGLADARAAHGDVMAPGVMGARA